MTAYLLVKFCECKIMVQVAIARSTVRYSNLTVAIGVIFGAVNLFFLPNWPVHCDMGQVQCRMECGHMQFANFILTFGPTVLANVELALGPCKELACRSCFREMEQGCKGTT